MKQEFLYIFSDGACQNNPGPGGWGTLILDSDGLVTEMGGFKDPTTNNQMELTAICEGLSFVLKFKKNKKALHIYTDSKYAVDGITKWFRAWIRNDWKTTSGKEVLNQDFWKRFVTLVTDLKEEREVFFHHVPAHVGLVFNERVDKIAVACTEKKKTYFYEKSLQDYPHSSALDTLDEDIEKAKSLKSKMSSKKKKKAFSYVSLVGGEVKIHKTWSECEQRVKGSSFARFKKSLSKEDEEKIIRDFKRT